MHRRSDEARADLLDIWIRLYDEAGERAADSQIDAITERFYLLAQYPYLGRDRNDDLGGMRRSYVVGQYVIIYRVDDGDVLILRVIDGRRDIEALFQRSRHDIPARRDKHPLSERRPPRAAGFGEASAAAKVPAPLADDVLTSVKSRSDQF